MVNDGQKAARAGHSVSPLTGGLIGMVRAARFLVGALILLSVALNCANVIGRYVFLAPIVWAEEILIYTMVWCVFVGAVLVTWQGGHLKMDLVSLLLPAPWRRAVNGLVLIAFISVAGFVVTQSVQVIGFFHDLGQVSTIAELPMTVPHGAVLLGFAAMLVAVLAGWRAHLRGEAEAEAARHGMLIGEDLSKPGT